ncbi:MAG: SEC-C metal-binding domain-containing protein [Candidatus Paceibacterota bacterium]|jgi:predicted aspartyl protease|nr:SEC-C metal-binding domain-containing protein [Bacteroidales bacterium]
MTKLPRASAFTLRYDGIAKALITECKVFPAYDPSFGNEPDHIKISCLWDTGATNSVISARLVQAINLKPIGKVTVSHAQGKIDANTYLINVVLPNNVGIPFLRVSEGILDGFDMLIGMDIISRGDFSISCSEKKTIFSFQFPSTHEVDYVAGKLIETPFRNTEKKPERNDPCPCRSGKKYKNCCGK